MVSLLLDVELRGLCSSNNQTSLGRIDLLVYVVSIIRGYTMEVLNPARAKCWSPSSRWVSLLGWRGGKRFPAAQQSS